MISFVIINYQNNLQVSVQCVIDYRCYINKQLVLNLMKVNLKMRKFDKTSVNFTKNNLIGKSCTPYKLYKIVNDNQSSLKRNMSINMKLFDENISCNRIKRLKSKNDRSDIYIEGGQVSVNSRQKPSTIKSKLKTFYQMDKNKKKSEIGLSKWNKQEKGAHSFRRFHRIIYKTQGVIKNQQGQLHHKIQFEETNRMNTLEENPEKQTEITNRHSFFSVQKSAERKLIMHQKSGQNHKTRIIANISKVAQQKHRSISSKPMFYVQPKQITHIRSESFVVVEHPSNQTILGNYYKKVYEIASLTKIMTFYTILQIADKYDLNLSESILEIDKQSESMTGTSAEITIGDLYTVEQLLYGLMLPSGNDAAMALAKWGGRILHEHSEGIKTNEIDSSKEEELWKMFVRQMNKVCRKIEMKSSRFANPHGLPNYNNVSTAQDLAILVSKSLQFDLFQTVVQTKKYTCQILHKDPETDQITKHEVVWENTNKLLRRKNFIGVKTGVTITAGPCLATCYKVPNIQKYFIIILLRAPKLSSRFKDTRNMLGLAMSKIDKKIYCDQIRQILKDDGQLDSDNSQQEQEFCFDRSDANEMAKRNRILAFE